MWAESVLPSLFPFMIICALLIKLGAPQAAAKPFTRVARKLKLPAAALPLFIMSACSGYPAGSKVLCEYADNGFISEEDVRTLAPLCSTCGPLFALGTVGTRAFGGNGAGAILLAACLISVSGSWLIFRLMTKRKNQSSDKPRPIALKKENSLYSVFYGGVTACLVAGGFICFFYTLSKVFDDFNIFKPLEMILALPFGKELAGGVCSGLCEATGGCFALARAGGFFALPLAGFLITFGGASIILQQTSYLSAHGVKTGRFVCFKFVQGILCFALICLFQLF